MMRPMTLGEIAAAVGCTDSYFLDNNAKITSISTDSRPQPEDGDRESCLFVALRGEVFDGHAYVGVALRNKAQYALVDKKGAEEYCKELPAQQLIVCEDTEQGFLDLAGAYRDRYHFRMVGVTGSVGKTTTKEMIAQVLSAQFETLKTQGNFNNRVGLPKTLLELDETVQAAVIEMGMNHFGEISDLTRRAKPDAAVITNIGVAHIEYLGSREGILKAKMEITEGMTPGSPLILNGDDDMLATVDCPQFKTIYYGMENKNCQVKGKDVREETAQTRFTILWNGQEFPAVIPTIGKHNVLNALAAFAVGIEFGMQPQTIVDALTGYKPSGMRQRVVQRSGICVVEDCYNAGPDSMKAAIQTFGSMQRLQKKRGRKILVMGDMLELGDYAQQAHYEAGECAGRTDIDIIICVGELCQAAVKGAQEVCSSRQKVLHFDDKEQLTEKLLSLVQPGDTLWIKGSRGMKLEEVLSRLYERF